MLHLPHATIFPINHSFTSTLTLNADPDAGYNSYMPYISVQNFAIMTTAACMR
jgi:hypothetical protein